MISYLQVENLNKRFGEKLLLENITFSINKDQKVALIAKNGTGKTTLLNIIAERDSADSGLITKRNDITIGYLEQNPQFNTKHTVIEHILLSKNDKSEAIELYNKALKSNDKAQLQKAAELMDMRQAWDFELLIKQTLSKLKLDNFDQNITELSGGQKKRLALANVIIHEPDLLILDEPTNHLDLEMMEWLEFYLLKSKCTLFMVTHDRYFLDRVCSDIIEIDNNQIFKYKGNYSYFVEKREERIQQTMASIEKARNIYRTELDWMRRMPQARATKAKSRIDNFYKVKDKAFERINNQQVELDIQSARLGKKILEIYNISKQFDKLKLIDDFTYKFARNEKIGIVGKNGTGKTTLLNIITGNEPPTSGHLELGSTVVFGHYKQDGIEIKADKRLIEVVKDISEEVDFGNGRKLAPVQFLDLFLFPSEMHYQQVAKLSGGERRRLYLLTVLMQNPNFLLLDEPTNDLDIMTLNVLEDYLLSFEGCVLVVSHDRYFMDKIVDSLFVFEEDGKISHFPGSYTQYREFVELEEKAKKKEEKQIKVIPEKPEKQTKKKFTYKEKKEFDALELEISQLAAERAEIESSLNFSNLPADTLIEKTKRLSVIINTLDEKELRWLELSELTDSD